MGLLENIIYFTSTLGRRTVSKIFFFFFFVTKYNYKAYLHTNRSTYILSMSKLNYWFLFKYRRLAICFKFMCLVTPFKLICLVSRTQDMFITSRTVGWNEGRMVTPTNHKRNMNSVCMCVLHKDIHQSVFCWNLYLKSPLKHHAPPKPYIEKMFPVLIMLPMKHTISNYTGRKSSFHNRSKIEKQYQSPVRLSN